MKRLTTEVPKDNIQAALNLFYIKDGWTWVRGGGPAPKYEDVSLCDYVRGMLKAYVPDAEIPDNDDDLSFMMAEWVMDGPENIEGMIASVYEVGWAFAELRYRLKDYEDTGLEPEEIKEILERYRGFRSAISDDTGQPMVSWGRAGQICRAEKEGRLLIPPCMVGDTVWIRLRPNEEFREAVVDSLHFEGGTYDFTAKGAGKRYAFCLEDIGDLIFLTSEEAEASLAKDNDVLATNMNVSHTEGGGAS